MARLTIVIHDGIVAYRAPPKCAPTQERVQSSARSATTMVCTPRTASPNAHRHRSASSPQRAPQQRWYARPERQPNGASRTAFPHSALARRHTRCAIASPCGPSRTSTPAPTPAATCWRWPPIWATPISQQPTGTWRQPRSCCTASSQGDFRAPAAPSNARPGAA